LYLYDYIRMRDVVYLRAAWVAGGLVLMMAIVTTAGAGGADGIRTHDLDGANVALSQLSYGPGTNTSPAGCRRGSWVGGAEGSRTPDL
jgi:hypothetical protein